MVSYFRSSKSLVRLAAIAALTALPACAAGINATATFTDVADPHTAGVYDYSITLNNTGTTTIGEFWFAWVPGAGFLSATPTNVGSPATWSDTVTNGGAAIQWIGATLLQPGQSLSGFTFDSTETPAQLLANFTGSGMGAGDPVTTSFVYIVTKTPSDAGKQFIVMAATPEPGTILLTLTGLSMTAGSIRSRFRRTV